MVSKMYKSDPGISLETYRNTYKRYASFKYGVFFIIALAAGIVYDAYNLYLWISFGCGIENILIHIGIALALAALIYPGIKLMKSGGKKYLFGRENTALYILPDHLAVIFTPAKNEYKKYEKVQQNIYYCDIQQMEYDSTKQRLRIVSEYEEKLFYTMTEEDGSETEDIMIGEAKKKEVYVYNQFAGFDEIMKLIEKTSPLVNIIYDNRIH